MKKFLFVVLGIGILSAAYASVPANTGDEAGIGEDADSTAIVQTVRDFFLSESIIPDVFPDHRPIDAHGHARLLRQWEKGKNADTTWRGSLHRLPFRQLPESRHVAKRIHRNRAIHTTWQTDVCNYPHHIAPRRRQPHSLCRPNRIRRLAIIGNAFH